MNLDQIYDRLKILEDFQVISHFFLLVWAAVSCISCAILMKKKKMFQIVFVDAAAATGLNNCAIHFSYVRTWL